MNKSGDWLSVEEAAAMKGVPADTVRKRIKRERLPAMKKSGVWLIRRADLDRWEVQRKLLGPLDHKQQPAKLASCIALGAAFNTRGVREPGLKRHTFDLPVGSNEVTAR